MKEKVEILLYNIESEEKAKIKNIFTELDININITEAKEADELIAYPSFCTFIKEPESKAQIQEIDEVLSILRGWQINFIVDKHFFENTEKIAKEIQDYYEEYKNIKVKYDDSDVIKDGIIGLAIGESLRI